ncbi:MAG: hypothetical protein WDN46_07805 [Methylocella sp.]
MIKTAFIAVILGLSLSTIAMADGDGRVIPFQAVLHGARGDELREPAPIDPTTNKPIPSVEGKLITLGDVAINALLIATRGDETLAGTEKVRRGELARNIFAHPEEPLKIDEIKLIKDRIGVVYTVDVVTPAWHILEGDKP